MRKVMLAFLLSVFVKCFAFDDRPAQLPSVQFQSVNTCRTVTGYEPNIAPVYADSPYKAHGPRRVEPGHKPDEPFPDPIGDVPWPIMLAFIAFYIIVLIKEQIEKFESRHELDQNSPPDTNF